MAIVIRSFNVSKSLVANLRGDHYAKTVYCKKLVKHPGDIHYGWLHCDDVIVEIPHIDAEYLQEDDRIYYGELHIRGIYGKDELGSIEIEKPEDFYPNVQ